MDLDKVAGFSMQGAAADEIEFDELRYRESAKQPTEQEMKERSSARRRPVLKTGGA